VRHRINPLTRPRRRCSASERRRTIGFVRPRLAMLVSAGGAWDTLPRPHRVVQTRAILAEVVYPAAAMLCYIVCKRSGCCARGAACAAEAMEYAGLFAGCLVWVTYAESLSVLSTHL